MPTRRELESPGELWSNIANTIIRSDSPAWAFASYGHRHTGAMDNNRVEILVTDLGRASDFQQYANIGGTPQWYYAHHQVRIAYTVVSATAERANTNYSFAIGRLGLLHAKDTQVFANANVQNLAVVDIEDEGVLPTVSDKETDRDRTTRSFLITYVVPPSVIEAAT